MPAPPTRSSISELLSRLSLSARDALSWSPKASLPGPSSLEAGAGRARDPHAASRAIEQLSHRYPLEALTRVCGASELAESLAALEFLARWLPQDLPAGRGLDVGARNAANLGGLVLAWPHGWDAVERDAHRRYWNGRTRRAAGEAMAGAFPGCQYIAADVRSLGETYSLVTWFLPFVTEAPLRAWGLPDALFDPPDVLRHVWGRVAPGGVLLVGNQGEGEAAVQGGLFEQAGIGAEALGRVESELSPYRRERWAWRARR